MRKKRKKLLSHLPPVSIGLLQENKPFTLPYADLPSIGTTVVVVILGLQDHRTTGDPAQCQPPGGHWGWSSRLLVPHRTSPSTGQHGSLSRPVQQLLQGACWWSIMGILVGLAQGRWDRSQASAMLWNKLRGREREINEAVREQWKNVTWLCGVSNGENMNPFSSKNGSLG